MVAKVTKFLNNNMKKLSIIALVLFLLIVVFISLFIWNQQLVNNNPESRCLASGGGWAPYWSIKDCNGNLLKNDSSLVIDEKTCWCHATSTCWNGKNCVEIINN